MATTWVINSRDLLNVQPTSAVREAPASAETNVDLVPFYAALSAMVRAGVPLYGALAQAGAPGHQLASMVENGQTLSASMAALPGTFPRMHCHLVALAEETGSLEAVLTSLAEEERRRRELAARIRSMLTYPAFLLAVSLLLILFMPAWVLPPFQEALDSLGVESPGFLKALLGVSKVGSSPVAWVLLLGVAAVGRLACARSRVSPEVVRQVQLRVPGLGPALERAAQARILAALALCSRVGLSLGKAIPLTSAVSGCPLKTQQATEAYRRLYQGASVTRSLAPLFTGNPAVLALVHVGERTGRLERMLGHAAQLLEEEVERNLQVAVSLVEPLVLAVAGLLVGGLVLSMLLPMARLVQGL